MEQNFENQGFERDYWARRQERWNRRHQHHRHGGIIPAVVLISVGAIFLLLRNLLEVARDFNGCSKLPQGAANSSILGGYLSFIISCT